MPAAPDRPRVGDGRLAAVEQVYRRWGRHPRLYAAQDWITFLGRHREIRRRAVSVLDLQPGARVLEVGCGTGRNFPYLLEAIGETGTLVGFDYSREMLRAAERMCQTRGWTNVELVQGDAAVLRVGGPPFDGVLSVLAMSAIPDHRSALSRCLELLRPGGRISVCDARPFARSLRVLNPLVRAIYVPLTRWEPEKPVLDHLEAVFGSLTLEEFNLGTFYIASAAKPAG